MELCKKYCDILRYEFIFNKPCQKLDNLLLESFDRLKEQALLSIPSVINIFKKEKKEKTLTTFEISPSYVNRFKYFVQEMNATEELRARRYYAHFDDISEDEYDAHSSDEITITLPAEGHGKRIVLASVLAPYSHTYMAVFRSLESLRDYGLLEGDFIKVCVREITHQVENGTCKYSMYI